MAQDVNIKIKVDTSQANNSTDNYKARLKQLKDEMTALQVETDGLTKASAAQRKRFSELSAEAGKIQDAMSDAAQQVKNLSDDYKGMTAALQGVQGAVGGITAISGAMNALGIDSEGASESIKKITSLMGIMQGVQQVQKALNKDSALMTALQTAKNKLLTKSIQEETAAQLALNAAKLAGVGAVTALVAVVGTLIYKYASAKNEIANFNKELNAQAAESIAPLIVKVNDLKDGYTALGDNLDAKKKFFEAHKEEIKGINAELDTQEKFEKALIDNTDAFIEAQKNRAKAEAARAKMTEIVKEQLSNQLEFERRYVKEQKTFWEGVVDWYNGAKFGAKEYGEFAKVLHEQEQKAYDEQIVSLMEMAKSFDDVASQLEKNIGLTNEHTEATKENTKAIKKLVEVKAIEAWEEEEIEEERLNSSLKVAERYLAIEQKKIEKRKAQEKEWQDWLDAEQAAAEKRELERAEKLEAEKQKIREAKWKAAEGMINAYGDLVNAAMEAELAAVGDNEEEQKRIRKKYARSKFLAQIGSIGVSTAQAIMEAWSSVAAIMFPGNVIAGGTLTAMLAATGIAQTMKARAEMDNALKAARGGILNGPSHAQGGIVLSNGVEAEGGEAIINKRSTAAFAPLLSEINSFNGYGAPLISSASASGATMGAASDEMIRRIVAATVEGVTSIPVVVSEHAVTEAQRTVRLTKERSII